MEFPVVCRIVSVAPRSPYSFAASRLPAVKKFAKRGESGASPGMEVQERHFCCETKVEERKRVGGLLSRVRPVKFAALHGNGLQGQARDFRRAARSPALPDQTGRDRYLRNLARK